MITIHVFNDSDPKWETKGFTSPYVPREGESLSTPYCQELVTVQDVFWYYTENSVQVHLHTCYTKDTVKT